jgi:membrane dipeptidase
MQDRGIAKGNQLQFLVYRDRRADSRQGGDGAVSRRHTRISGELTAGLAELDRVADGGHHLGMRNLLLAALAATALSPASAQSTGTAAGIEQRVERVLTAVPLSDGHNDWPYALRQAYGVEGAKTANLIQPATVRSTSVFSTGEATRGHTSIPLIRKGHLGLQLWSVYVPASLSPDEAVKQTFEQIAIARTFADRYPESFANVTTADEAERAWKSGRLAGFLALEGAHQVADDIPTLRRAHAAGVRAMTLSHSQPTRLFDSATSDPRHNGIAADAPAMIAEMNRLGVLVDLSHVSPTVMKAVLGITRSPVIFSHSSAKAVTNHPRNVPDDVLQRLKANGGIVMITFVPAFINQARADWETRRQAQRMIAGQGAEGVAQMKAWDAENPRPVTTLAMVADHIGHAARVAGHDHVGLGGDFDGVPDLPVGLEDVSSYPALFAELARRGWSDENLRKLAGLNFLRVLRENEKVALKMSRTASAGISDR